MEMKKQTGQDGCQNSTETWNRKLCKMVHLQFVAEYLVLVWALCFYPSMRSICWCNPCTLYINHTYTILLMITKIAATWQRKHKMQNSSIGFICGLMLNISCLFELSAVIHLRDPFAHLPHVWIFPQKRVSGGHLESKWPPHTELVKIPCPSHDASVYQIWSLYVKPCLSY